MNLTEQRFSSAVLENTRALCVRTPGEQIPPELILILLDAEYYLRMPSLWTQIDRLETAGVIPPTKVVLVSHLDESARRRECVCDIHFAQFTADELIPEILTDQNSLPIILGGLSLSGLAAAYVAISRPERIDGVICQSPSLWWSEGKILEIAAEHVHSKTVWRICVGNEESGASVDHGPGLLQSESQLSVCRRFRELLKHRGVALSYAEYNGGHKLEAWERDLFISLTEIVRLLRERNL